MSRLILGHTTSSSIKIWVRGSERWPFAFIDVLNEQKQKQADTKILPLPKDEFYCSVLEWTGLQPDTQYRVKLAFAKSPKAEPDERIRESYTEGNFKTFPQDNSHAKFSFLLGSCNLHSLGILERPDRAWVEISRIAKHNGARFMIHGGDQIYSDIPLMPSADVQHFRDKYLDAWDDCVPAKRVLTELPHYMILDDHEIINNFDLSKDVGYSRNTLLYTALKAYWEFQHMHNPGYNNPFRVYHYQFNYGKAHFFALDTRTRRRPNEGEMIDHEQEVILLDWLEKNKDEVKFIISSVPFLGEVRSPAKDKWCDRVYDAQRGRILQFILEKSISKVVFLTGDMHASYHASMTISHAGKQAVLHELMSSPINQFTPDLPASHQFELHPGPRQVGNVLTQSQIHGTSYYGRHSNVMLVSLDAAAQNKVDFQIFRTTKTAQGPTGSFML